MNIGSIASLSQQPFDHQLEMSKLGKMEEDLSTKDKEKLEQACQDFEAILLGFMMKQMRNTVPETKLIHGGQAEGMFKDMQDQEMAQEISSSSQFGLASSLYQQLSRNIS